MSDITASRTTVATSATAVLTNGGEQVTAWFKNANANTDTFYLGPDDVTTSTGFELAPGEAVPLTVYADSIVYAISAAGTDDIHVLTSLDI